MQDPIVDSVNAIDVTTYDPISLQKPVYIETKPSHTTEFTKGLYSTDITKESIPDWYFIVIIIILSALASARIFYGKFLHSVWVSFYSFQLAGKTNKDRGIVQRRFGIGLDLLYLVNASLFLYLLNSYFDPGIIETEGAWFVLLSFAVLTTLIFLRILTMRLISFLFQQSELFLGFLYHYFIFSKVTGMVLLPFLIAIPYTHGKIQEALIFTGISLIILIQIMRLFRVAFYVIKNVVLLYYLILYLCILEILPVLVIIKILFF